MLWPALLWGGGASLLEWFPHFFSGDFYFNVFGTHSWLAGSKNWGFLGRQYTGGHQRVFLSLYIQKKLSFCSKSWMHKLTAKNSSHDCSKNVQVIGWLTPSAKRTCYEISDRHTKTSRLTEDPWHLWWLKALFMILWRYSELQQTIHLL